MEVREICISFPRVKARWSESENRGVDRFEVNRKINICACNDEILILC